MAEKNLRSLKFPGSDDIYKIAQPDYAQTDSTQPDFIKNKIVGDVVEHSDTLIWDGKDPGLGNISIEEAFMVLYRVSENTVSLEDLKNGVEVEGYSYDNEFNATVHHYSFSYEDLIIQNNAIFIDVGYIFIALNDNSVFETDGISVNFEKAGIYFAEQLETQITKSLTIPGYSGFAAKTVKKLDKKYFDVTWDNVKDKPFGIDWDNPTVLIDNQTCVISDGMGVLQDVEFGAGLYKIIFDGVTYIRTAVENNGFVLGNGAIAGLPNDTGEPFFLGYSQGMCILGGTEGEHTLSLIRPVINKIDTMFYDTKTVFYYELGSDVYLYKDLNGTKATLEELTEAVQKGVVEVSYGGFLYSLCKFVSIERSYGIVVIGANLVDGALVDKVLYTAEYTP